MERTLAIVKPDAFDKREEILAAIAAAGFTVEQQMETMLTLEQAQAFYAEHSERPFYAALTAYMSSGPVVVAVLHKPGADTVAEWRVLLGPTDAAKAKADAPDSLRAKYGTDVERNALHGSDSPASATREITFFFAGDATATESVAAEAPAPAAPAAVLSPKKPAPAGEASLAPPTPAASEAVAAAAPAPAPAPDAAAAPAPGAEGTAGAAAAPAEPVAPVEPPKPKDPKEIAKEYLDTKLQPTLTAALSELAKATPLDPVQFLVDYLRQHNPHPPPPPPKHTVFVLGGPGSGKGTQSARIVKDFGWDHVSAGDLLRDEVQSKSEQGRMIGEMIKNGQIVPGEITVGLLKRAVENSKAPGILVDGFPRKIDQAGMFESMVGPAQFVLFFDCPEEVMEARLLERGKTSGRTDDNIKTIKKRFKTFVEQSMPVVAYYEAKNMVHKVDATKSIDEVYARICHLFGTPLPGVVLPQPGASTAPAATAPGAPGAAGAAPTAPVPGAPIVPAPPAAPEPAAV